MVWVSYLHLVLPRVPKVVTCKVEYRTNGKLIPISRSDKVHSDIMAGIR